MTDAAVGYAATVRRNVRCGLALVIALVAACHRSPPPTPAAGPEPARARRAVYVGDAAALLAAPAERARLTRLAASGRLTDVVPYRLGPLLSDAEGRARIAAWFDELRGAGARVTVPIAGEDRLRALDVLVAEHAALRIDGLVTELEYWNQTDRAGAFAALLELLGEMRRRAAAWQRAGDVVACGVYLGYPTAAEAERLAHAIDFAFLNYSVRSAGGAWHHVHARHGSMRARFAALALARGRVALWPIFYATGEVDMGAELARGGVDDAEARFRADLNADRELGGTRLGGFVYFTFEALPR